MQVAMVSERTRSMLGVIARISSLDKGTRLPHLMLSYTANAA